MINHNDVLERKSKVAGFRWSAFHLAVFMLCMGSVIALAQNPVQPERPQAQDPSQTGVIKVDTALVNVPVIVTDRNSRFVTGLARSSFRITEDGVPQEITSFSSTEAPFNVALLLDTSHSTQRKMGPIRKAALTFIKQLQPSDRVALVTFDDEVRFASDFTSDRRALENAIGQVKSNYRTSLYDAIARTVNEKLSSISGRKAMVILTDGVDTGSKTSSFEQSLELVSSAGVIAYTIQYETRNDGGPLMRPLNLPGRFLPSHFMPQGQASSSGEKPPDRYVVAAEFLKYLAAASGGRYLRAENIESTSYAFSLIADELRNQYTLAYYSSNDRRDGRFREIGVNLNERELFVRARRGYRAPLSK